MNSSSLPPPYENAPEDFCLALKTARERRRITLAQIATATKVCPSHLAALERGDLRLWPKGLIRRGFFRGYAGMVGLPVEETLEAFLRLFPDEPGAARPAQPCREAPPLPLVLDSSWHGPKTPIVSRVVTAAVDIFIVMLMAIAIAWPAVIDAGTSAAIAAVSYFTIATVLFGESPVMWAIRRRRPRPAHVPEETSETEGPEPSLIARVWRHGVEAAILPREPSRWRVRVKWSP